MAIVNLMEGRGVIAPPQPQPQPQTHVVRTGDTLNDLASRYGVQPHAIKQANPDIYRHLGPDRREQALLNGGDVLWAGDVLVIPGASMSVTEPPIDSDDVSPAFPSPNSEYRVGGITFNPGDGTVKLTAEQQLELAESRPGDVFGLGQPGRGGVKFEFVSKRELTAGIGNKNGDTELTVEFQADISLKGGAGHGGTAIEAGVGAGTRIKYKVVLPGENRDPGKVAFIDPTDPSLIPDGATITMDGQVFANTAFGASFQYAATHSQRVDAAGMTYSITRKGDSISVLVGPTQVVEAFSGAGIRVGDVTAIAGRQDLLSDSRLQAATFALDRPDSQAAYSHFLATGQIADRTDGVSGVAAIERVDMSSQTRVKLEAGPIGFDIAGAQSTASYVRAEFPDGSSTQTFEFNSTSLYGGVPVQITSRFDASGEELLSRRTYAYTLKTEEGSLGLLNMALTGGSPNGPAKPGGPITLSFDHAQMTRLMSQAGVARNAYSISSQGDRLGILLGEGDPDRSVHDRAVSFAVRMGTTLGSDPYKFCDRLVEIARGADGDLFGGGMTAIQATVS
ncbi:LysM peptidoglycan-binding domain-containing protein [Lysobacter sp. 1R34A]|uniref:LysM peptidoglycan-binding domain-containing protein n=1 Tax=Lysobacter sp. 1R34A TaxID=3445786 RepID=UPI003EEAE113